MYLGTPLNYIIMKNYFLLTFFVILFSINFLKAQDSISPNVAKVFLAFIKNQDITNEAQKNFLIDEIKTKILTQKDSILVNAGLAYIEVLNSKQLEKAFDIDISKYEDVDKKIFRVEEDKFTGTVIIHHKKLYGSSVMPYIVVSKAGLQLAVDFEYSGKDWIFMNKVTFLIDGITNTVNLEDVDRKPYGGTVYERSTLFADDYLISIMKLMASSKNQVDLRFQGDYIGDRINHRRFNPYIGDVLVLLESLKKAP